MKFFSISETGEMHGQKVDLWYAISRNRIICPLFLDDTINLERYCEGILYPFIGHLNEDEISHGCFQRVWSRNDVSLI
jgi:hypothetical protein